MSVETTANRISYAGNGVTTVFAFPYRFLAGADLVVIERTNSTGAEVVKTITTHYTVAANGNVTMLVAPATGKTLIIYNDPTKTQGVDLRENDSLPAESVEEALDRATLIAQRLGDRVVRTVRLPDGFSPTFDPKLPVDLDTAGDKIPLINAGGTGFAAASAWPSITGVTAGMAASAAAAAASASAASTSASAASTSASAASTSASAASTSATNAASSASAASSSATAAAASAAAAASTLASALWRGVVRKTAADSPYTVLAADNGKLIVVDTTAGAVVINLPGISGLTLPFTLGVQLDAGTNAITVNKNGTDTIDGATSKSITVLGSGAQFLADTTPAPDEWEVIDFGAQSGNLTVDRFNGTGAQTAFTLSVDPGSENNTFVYVEGIYQQKDTYSVSGTTLTFSEAPPSGTNNVEVIIGTTLSIGAPSDGTITPAKLADAAFEPSALLNYSLTASVASNALTVAIKDKAGNNPSAASPVKLSFRNATATTGDYNIQSISAALSVVLSSGSTLGHASAVNQYVHVYAIDNAGSIELAVCGTRLDEGALQTTVAEGGAGAADSNTVLYSTTARTNVPIRYLGRLKSSQATAGTWATAISEISLLPANKYKNERSEVRLHTGNGHGSTNTKIRRFTTTVKNVGSAITYTDSAANGASFTINEDGLYYIGAVDLYTTDSTYVGISLNSTQLTTFIYSITAADVICYVSTASSQRSALAAATVYLRAGDIVRHHTDGFPNASGQNCAFCITKLTD